MVMSMASLLKKISGKPHKICCAKKGISAKKGIKKEITLEETVEAARAAASVSDEVLKSIERKSCGRVTVSVMQGSIHSFIILTQHPAHMQLTANDVRFYSTWSGPAYLDQNAVCFQHLLERGCRLTFGRANYESSFWPLRNELIA